MAVYAAPDPTFSSTNTVSCKSNVVSPESKFVGLLLENFSAPITNLVPALFKSKEQLLEIGSLKTKFRVSIEENANSELVLNNLILNMKT